MKNKLGAWLGAQTNAIQIDKHLLTHSRAARTSKRLIQASVIVNSLGPAIAIVSILCLTAVGTMAQGPSGGTIFGGNDQTLGNGVRELIKWGRNLLFLLGLCGIGWAIINFMSNKSCVKQALGGGFCMAFGSIASLVYSFSQGNAVNLDTDLGN